MASATASMPCSSSRRSSDRGPACLFVVGRRFGVRQHEARHTPGPRRVARLVLADTKAPADDEHARQGRDQMIARLDDQGIEAVADVMVPRLLGATTQRHRPDVVQQVRSLILDNQPEGVERAILRLRDRPDATAGVAAITVPTRVLVGDEDEVTPPAEAQRLAAAIAGARLERIPFAGHLACPTAAGVQSCALDVSRQPRLTGTRPTAPMNLELTEKVAIVTGTSRGLVWPAHARSSPKDVA